MQFYIDVTLDIYDNDTYTYAVGPYPSTEAAGEDVTLIRERLTTGGAKQVLDTKYGVTGYSVSVVVMRLRNVDQVIEDVLEGDAQ